MVGRWAFHLARVARFKHRCTHKKGPAVTVTLNIDRLLDATRETVAGIEQIAHEIHE